jgi:hypothetical protein
MTLAEELGSALSLELEYGRPHPRNLLMLKYLRDEDIYGNDIDSGHSTSHSPDGLKSTSPPLCTYSGNIFYLTPSIKTFFLSYSEKSHLT